MTLEEVSNGLTLLAEEAQANGFGGAMALADRLFLTYVKAMGLYVPAVGPYRPYKEEDNDRTE